MQTRLSGLSPPVSAALPHPATPFRLCTWAPQIFCATSGFPEALHKALQFLPTERGPSVPSDQRSLLPPARLPCALSRLLLQDTWCCQVQELENWRAVTVSPCCVPCVPSTTQRHSQQSESVTSASQGQSPAHCNIPNPQRQTTRSPSHWTGAPGNPHCSWRHFYAVSALVSHVRFLTSFVPNVLYCMPGSVLGWTDEWTRGRGVRREGRVEGENSEERRERGEGGDSQALSPLSGNSEPTGSVYNPKSSIQQSSLHIT